MCMPRPPTIYGEGRKVHTPEIEVDTKEVAVWALVYDHYGGGGYGQVVTKFLPSV